MKKFFIVFLLLAAVVVGCGKKRAPEPAQAPVITPEILDSLRAVQDTTANPDILIRVARVYDKIRGDIILRRKRIALRKAISLSSNSYQLQEVARISPFLWDEVGDKAVASAAATKDTAAILRLLRLSVEAASHFYPDEEDRDELLRGVRNIVLTKVRAIVKKGEEIKKIIEREGFSSHKVKLACRTELASLAFATRLITILPPREGERWWWPNTKEDLKAEVEAMREEFETILSYYGQK